MKWFWLLMLLIILGAFYVFSFLAFNIGMDIVAWPMVIGGGFVMMVLSREYIREYWV